jgi:uncharacterized membrane protein
MTAMLLSIVGCVFAFRGSYLIKTAKTDQEKQYGLLVSLSAAILSLVSMVLLYV